MHGFLNVNKPSGITSRAAVDMVSRVCRKAKVGHTGTLDPLASGVLVICVGETTRLAEYIQQMPKTYLATFLLDRKSETDDIEQGFQTLPNRTKAGSGELTNVLSSFVGEIDQVPPRYSAAKVSGRRAYTLARQKADFVLQSRKVNIYNIRLLRFEYPEFELEVRCGAGTYIRALGRDIALQLNTCAVMSSLIRTQVGEFKVESAIDPLTMDFDSIGQCLHPPAAAVEQLRQIVLTDVDISELRFGRTIANRFQLDSTDQPVAAMNSAGELIALVRLSQENQLLRPHRNFGFVPGK